MTAQSQSFTPASEGLHFCTRCDEAVTLSDGCCDQCDTILEADAHLEACGPVPWAHPLTTWDFTR